MEIEFDCGATATNVGEVVMALRHHLVDCEDADCRRDVQTYLNKA